MHHTVHSGQMDNTGICSVTSTGTANSTREPILGIGTTPCRARTGSIRGHTHKEENVVKAGLVLYIGQKVNQPTEGDIPRNKGKTVCIGFLACWNGS